MLMVQGPVGVGDRVDVQKTIRATAVLQFRALRQQALAGDSPVDHHMRDMHPQGPNSRARDWERLRSAPFAALNGA